MATMSKRPDPAWVVWIISLLLLAGIAGFVFFARTHDRYHSLMLFFGVCDVYFAGSLPAWGGKRTWRGAKLWAFVTVGTGAVGLVAFASGEVNNMRELLLTYALVARAIPALLVSILLRLESVKARFADPLEKILAEEDGDGSA